VSEWQNWNNGFFKIIWESGKKANFGILSGPPHWWPRFSLKALSFLLMIPRFLSETPSGWSETPRFSLNIQNFSLANQRFSFRTRHSMSINKSWNYVYSVQCTVYSVQSLYLPAVQSKNNNKNYFYDKDCKDVKSSLVRPIFEELNQTIQHLGTNKNLYSSDLCLSVCLKVFMSDHNSWTA